jgi:hypothetical protein
MVKIPGRNSKIELRYEKHKIRKISEVVPKW